MTKTRASISSLIESYLEKLSPVCPDPWYIRNLDRLAEKLQKMSTKLSTEEIYYCYVYLDPRYPGKYDYVLPSGKVVRFKYRPFYVGKGKNGRSLIHIREAEKHPKPVRWDLKGNILRKLFRHNLAPIITITHTRESESLALAFEVDLIAGIGRRDKNEGPLANRTNGSDGNI